MPRRPTVRVLTYNIHKGYCTGNRRFVLEGMRAHIRETRADIVLLQEIHGRMPRNGRRARGLSFPDTAHFEYLADEAWPHYAYGRNAIYRHGDHGNAILSKYPFVEWENINVARFPRSSRSILHGVVEVPGSDTRLHILCVHLGLFEGERKAQIKVLCDRIESHVPHAEPLIIGGDFNDWWGKAERYLHASLEVSELFRVLEGRHARTYPIWRPLVRLDRIYYRGVQPLACECLANDGWGDLSDHAALLGEFRVG